MNRAPRPHDLLRRYRVGYVAHRKPASSGKVDIIVIEELENIREHVANLFPERRSFPLKIGDDIHTASGIYAFLSRGPRPHLYVGKSVDRLGDRVSEQLHLRRWAT